MADNLWDAVMERTNLIERLAKTLEDQNSYQQLYIATSFMSTSELREFVEWQEKHEN